MKKLVLLLILFAVSGLYAQSYNVTFKVDMTVQIGTGVFATGDVVTVKGNFNSWSDSDAMVQVDSSNVYQLTVSIPASALTDGKIYYKFFSHKSSAANGGWETIADNRSAAITGDVVLPLAYFNDQAATGAASTITFTVDMHVPAKQNADFNTYKVFVAGDFTSPSQWGDGALEMTSAGNDSVYTVTAENVTSGKEIQYKFIYSKTTAGAGSWESVDNRKLFVLDGTQSVSKFWNDIDPNTTFADGSINFQVDMSVMEELGFFNLSLDSLRLRGAFNSWGDADHAKSFMNQDPLVPTNYYINIPFLVEKVGAGELFKFKIQKKNETGALTGDHQYERPLSEGGGNRSATFAGVENQATTPEVIYFNDIRPEFVIKKSSSAIARFAVDMTNAVALGFDSSSDTVFIVCGVSTWAQMMGGAGNWKEDGDRVIKMTHTTGNLYTGSLQINGPAYNGFIYTYEFSKGGELQKEKTGYGSWARRVRYIPMTGPNACVTTYEPKVDQWSLDETKAATEYETWPDGLVDVKQINTGIPQTYSLDQNYPNPFNPTTKIRFSIPQEAQVSLKIYNVLGQEVASLINERLKAGNYSSEFNASKVASGVYFYRIEAGSFSMTKKMIFIK
jgi:hypothetical protein